MLPAVVLLLAVASQCAVGEEREKRSAPGYHGDQQQGYVKEFGYEKHTYKKKSKSCYQCAYSPPKTYYDKKVIKEQVHYQKDYGYQQKDGGYGKDKGGHYGQKYGGYEKKTYVPIPYKINGGWDKCLGPFDHYQAKRFGVDVWDCHSNCYVRKDPNGNIFRGCYKGEFGVDPYRLGCHYQAGSIYCFCKGDKCNNGPAPH